MVLRIVEMVGLAVAAVFVPGMALAVRHTCASWALVIGLWALLASAIASTLDRIDDDVPLGIPDWLRVFAVVMFAAFLVLYRRGRDARS